MRTSGTIFREQFFKIINNIGINKCNNNNVVVRKINGKIDPELKSKYSRRLRILADTNETALNRMFANEHLEDN